MLQEPGLISARCSVVPGTRVSIPRAEDGRSAATRVRAGRGGLQIVASSGEPQPIVCHLGGERGGEDGDDQVHPAVPVFGHQQCQHVGRAADPGG